jgi:hypothetical protein
LSNVSQADTDSFGCDFDGDGLSDEVIISKQKEVEDSISETDIRVQIKFSSKAQDVDVKFLTDEDFHVYISKLHPRSLVIDRTRSAGWKYSKSYDLYVWDDGYKKMCLHASVYQEMFGPSEPKAALGMPKQSYVRAYNKCEEIGGDVPGPEITDQGYWDTYHVSAKVVVDKSWLYSSPNVKNKTKMYLVKDDTLVIKEHRYVKEKDWYLIEYMPADKDVPVIKWVQGHSIGLQLSI